MVEDGILLEMEELQLDTARAIYPSRPESLQMWPAPSRSCDERRKTLLENPVKLLLVSVDVLLLGHCRTAWCKAAIGERWETPSCMFL